MKVFGAALFIFGGLLIAGSASADDYWEACRHAVDCVAGDPPTGLVQIAEMTFGLIFAIVGCRFLMLGFDQD